MAILREVFASRGAGVTLKNQDAREDGERQNREQRE